MGRTEWPMVKIVVAGQDWGIAAAPE